MSRILLVNPHSAISVYDKSKIKVAITSAPFVTLASLPLTYAKASMTLPFPSSPMFRQIKREGRILSENWDLYNLHSTSEVWKHENLEWDEIQHYYARFHRKFHFRPSYILRRFWRDVRMGQLLKDIKAVFAMTGAGDN